MAPDSSYRAGDVEVREEIDFSGVLDGVLTPDSRDNRFTAHSYLCVVVEGTSYFSALFTRYDISSDRIRSSTLSCLLQVF